MGRRSQTFAACLVVVGIVVPPGFATPAARGSDSWAYTGQTGPAYWGLMGYDYLACKEGKAQSPVDIRDDSVRKSGLPPIVFHYQPSKLQIADTGHTLEVSYTPGSFISIGNKRYELKEFHFHKPSEEKVNGKTYDMVAHLVHESADGELAVVAVLLTKGDKANSLVKMLWDNVPKKRRVEVSVDAVTIDATELLPTDKSYYTFVGSLTTPPCTEGVTWLVLKTPTVVSADEVARFAQLYPMNARPEQPLNGREVETGG